MVNAQKWLDENYLKEERINVIILDINDKNLEGELRLEGFVNLERLSCCYNQLTSLIVGDCPNIKKICCWKNQLTSLSINGCNNLNSLNAGYNQLTNLDLTSLGKLKVLQFNDNYLTNLNYLPLSVDELIYLNVTDNNFPKQDLSCFERFVNLKVLLVGSTDEERIKKDNYNRFHGSLEFLKNMNELKLLDISNTDIDSGLEYLTNGKGKIYSTTKERPESKVKELLSQFFVNNKEGKEYSFKVPKNNAFLLRRDAQEWLEESYPSYKRKGMKELKINETKLKGSLNLAGFSDLLELYIYGDGITELNLKGVPKLEKLYCKNGSLKSLDISKNKYLTVLDCSNNELNSLDTSNNKSLIDLDCSDNKLTNLDLSKSNSLKKLCCWGNELKSTKFLEKLPKPERLKFLDISDNKFYPQDLSVFEGFFNLEYLNLENNPFYGSLDSLKKLTNLQEVDANDTHVAVLKAEDCRCSKIIEQMLEKDSELIWRKGLNRQADNEELREGERTEAVGKSSELIVKYLFEKKASEKGINHAVLREVFEKKIKERVKGEMEEIDHFETWFNPSCAVVVTKKKSSLYTIRVVIYKPVALESEKEVLRVIKISKHKSLEEARVKVEETKKILNGDNPILAIAESNLSPTDIIEEFELRPDIDPEKHLEPLDIIWRKMTGTPVHHAAIYLGDNQVAHISIPEEDEGGKNFFEKVVGRIDVITKISNSKKSAGARIDTWKKFLKKTENKLIRRRPVIPFKRPEKIVEHIAKVISSQYGEEEYNLFNENCQHFVTLCVYGVPFSEQAEIIKLSTRSIDLGNEIKKTDYLFKKFEFEVMLRMMRENSLWELRNKSEVIKQNNLEKEEYKELDEILENQEKLVELRMNEVSQENVDFLEGNLERSKKILNKKLSCEEINEFCRVQIEFLYLERWLNSFQENKQCLTSCQNIQKQTAILQEKEKNLEQQVIYLRSRYGQQ